MRSDIVPGAFFPDYELTDHTAKRRKLSELQGQHPMVLVLSRGGYCPKDRRHSELLVQLHRELEVGYCRLVTIGADNITLTNEYRSGVGAPAVPFGYATKCSKGSRHCRIYRSRPRSDDSTCHCSGTGPRHIQDLQRLLVFRPPDA